MLQHWHNRYLALRSLITPSTLIPRAPVTGFDWIRWAALIAELIFFAALKCWSDLADLVANGIPSLIRLIQWNRLIRCTNTSYMHCCRTRLPLRWLYRLSCISLFIFWTITKLILQKLRNIKIRYDWRTPYWKTHFLAKTLHRFVRLARNFIWRGRRKIRPHKPQ